MSATPRECVPPRCLLLRRNARAPTCGYCEYLGQARPEISTTVPQSNRRPGRAPPRSLGPNRRCPDAPPRSSPDPTPPSLSASIAPTTRSRYHQAQLPSLRWSSGCPMLLSPQPNPSPITAASHHASTRALDHRRPRRSGCISTHSSLGRLTAPASRSGRLRSTAPVIQPGAACAAKSLATRLKPQRIITVCMRRFRRHPRSDKGAPGGRGHTRVPQPGGINHGTLTAA